VYTDGESENLKGRDHFKDLDLDEMILLEWIWKK